MVRDGRSTGIHSFFVIDFERFKQLFPSVSASGSEAHKVQKSGTSKHRSAIDNNEMMIAICTSSILVILLSSCELTLYDLQVS